MNTLEERADLLLAVNVRFVRRLSTVRSRHGLIDFEKSMIMKKLREVERVERLGASFEFDSLLCSQRAKGAAPASVVGWWFKGRALAVSAARHGSIDGARGRWKRGAIGLERLKDC
jgi:hypothetical protein